MSAWLCSTSGRHGEKRRTVCLLKPTEWGTGLIVLHSAKYGLAITDALLDAFGPDLGEGYDIGCGFATTIKNSPIGEKARRLNLRALVGAFHGHAHNRMCQLRFLTTYVRGLGLEDLEGCERFFSKSNALSRSTRYASVFHRRQSIATYLAHVDNFETYANLSKLLFHWRIRH